MEALQQAAAVAQSRRDPRPFAERFQQLAGLLQVPMLDFIAARGAAELSAMLDEPDSVERRPGSPAARLMEREVDHLGERLRPLGRALLPALEAAQRSGGRQRSFEVAVALLHQHQAALSLLTMSCSFLFEGSIPATVAALRGAADGYTAMVPALLPLMQAVRQRCQPSRDGRLLGAFVMQHCDCLWRTVGCFQVVRGGEQWPLFEAVLPASIALPWVRELVTWADLSGPHHFDLSPTLAMLGRLLLVHEPLQAALEQDLPLQRKLLRLLLKVVVPPAGAPETLTWVGDVEDAAQILCCPGMETALQEHVASPAGLRTLQAAARLLQQPLPDVDASLAAGSARLEEARHAVSKHTAQLQLLETMLGAELGQPTSQERAAIAACLLAEGQQAVVAAVAAWRALLRAPGSSGERHGEQLVPVCRSIAVASLSMGPDLLQGRRGVQAALSGLHSTLCLVWQLGQLHGEAAAHGPQLAQLVSITRGAAMGMYPLALSLTVAIEAASEEEAAANSGGLSPIEQLRMVLQAHTACCCVVQGMPDQTIPQQSQLISFCDLLAILLRAAVNLAQQCSDNTQADAQRLLDSMLLEYLALAKHLQQRPGTTGEAALRLLLLEPCLTSRPELQAGFEAGGGLALYMQAIQTLCQDPPAATLAEVSAVLEDQLQPPHANQAAAAELVASGLHRVLANGGQPGRAEGSAELARALRELARKAVVVLGQAGSERYHAGTEPSIEEPFVALDSVIQDSLEGRYFRLTPAALKAAEPLAQALQQLWEQQRQAPEPQAETRVRMARAAALRTCANLACPNQATGGALKTKRCSGCKAVRYCCAACQTEDWRVGGHRHACKLLQAEGGSA